MKATKCPICKRPFERHDKELLIGCYRAFIEQEGEYFYKISNDGNTHFSNGVTWRWFYH